MSLTNKKRKLNPVWLIIALFLIGCSSTGKPEGIEPVSTFQLDRYLGTWYEIARLDHKFERGLTKVSATYSLKSDGTVKVVNRGFSNASSKWKEATGKARFVGSNDQGHLKVSFFGPFYGSYIVFELDKEDYQYALVSGPDRGYLWLLARTPEIDETLYNRLLAKAEEQGFDASKIIRVIQ